MSGVNRAGDSQTSPSQASDKKKGQSIEALIKEYNHSNRGSIKLEPLDSYEVDGKKYSEAYRISTKHPSGLPMAILTLLKLDKVEGHKIINPVELSSEGQLVSSVTIVGR